MIEIKEVSKSFGKKKALDKLNLTIEEGGIFGLVGSNGAGKSTLLRIMAGVYKADRGQVLIDGQNVFENPEIKQKICFLPDSSYFFNDATPNSAADYYGILYPAFDHGSFKKILKKLQLDPDGKVRSFSKGMRRQLTIALALCTGAKYLFLDETFDGLDPVARQAVKSALAEAVYDQRLVPVIASHNLREIEDISDHVGFLHKGGVLLSKDMNDNRTDLTKLHCAFRSKEEETELLSGLNVLQYTREGSLLTLVVRGEKEEVMEKVMAGNPVFAETIPMTLEEIFISEMEGAGYDLRNFND
ncbi:MAG: ABC transporter ATP-binding protein [Eubacterium sp.]|nr:ABC transporter ATP-binding protein [Eubacterium sp.]